MPAGLPCGKPGMGDEMEGAMQHAAHAGRQFMATGSGRSSLKNKEALL